MSIVTKLIGMIALGQTAAETRLAVQNFLTGLISVLVLALVAGLMIGALLVGLHIALYIILLKTTMLTDIGALGVTLAVGVMLTGIIVALAVTRMKTAFTLTKQLHAEEYQQPVSSRVVGVAEAFIDGLFGRSRYRS